MKQFAEIYQEDLHILPDDIVRIIVDYKHQLDIAERYAKCLSDILTINYESSYKRSTRKLNGKRICVCVFADSNCSVRMRTFYYFKETNVTLYYTKCLTHMNKLDLCPVNHLLDAVVF